MRGPPSVRAVTSGLVRVAAAGAVVAAALAPAWVRRPAGPVGDAAPERLRRLVVQTPWPEWRRRRTVTDPALLQGLDAGPARMAGRPGRPPGTVWTVWVLRLETAAGAPRELWVLDDGRLWDPVSGTQLQSRAAVDAARRAVDALAAQMFGEAVPWHAVHPLFPLDSYIILEDVRTGARLRVRRYGGYLHADVEPATTRDTAVLEALYGGSWSWRRRPVVAILGGRRVAASINGMPHGQGMVRDNAFEGHFCLHFLESRIHRTGRADPSHQLMVWEAAGRLPRLVAEASPTELVAWALAAVNEADEAALSLASVGEDEALRRRLLEEVHHVAVLGARAVEGSPSGPGPVVEVEALVYLARNPDAGLRRTLRFALHPRRPGGAGSGWAVALRDLAAIAAPPAGELPASAATAPGC